MKIKEITWQNRRDFRAIYICEHCRNEHDSSGYDDENFHNVVIPDMTCEKCGKKSKADYRPLAPKYSKDLVL